MTSLATAVHRKRQFIVVRVRLNHPIHPRLTSFELVFVFENFFSSVQRIFISCQMVCLFFDFLHLIKKIASLTTEQKTRIKLKIDFLTSGWQRILFHSEQKQLFFKKKLSWLFGASEPKNIPKVTPCLNLIGNGKWGGFSFKFVTVYHLYLYHLFICSS